MAQWLACVSAIYLVMKTTHIIVYQNKKRKPRIKHTQTRTYKEKRRKKIKIYLRGAK